MAVIIGLAWGAAKVMTRVASGVYDHVSPNANETDALADHGVGDPSQDAESDTEPAGW
jgi:hypothetical protein